MNSALLTTTGAVVNLPTAGHRFEADATHSAKNLGRAKRSGLTYLHRSRILNLVQAQFNAIG